ncbi:MULTISPECIES: DNA methyltransferase [Enterobacteriaceae]|uniref:DNA methylase n=1 Tax=Klebsiella oxytoca TaxID=571 RepID=A0AAD3UKP5_KLEOX|nr:MULTISPECIES: DNA methyltransferase [Enterobacteriaceae]ELE6493747.1 hypothetical protein [Enterobacter kobei]ELT9682515.1 hypothetical protein [Klebsiella oxytoca]ELE6496461.1 hypothetical protein [Enterobacter kobei]ELT9976133.1 hypothetical protein [Klebsiella oxytoca]MBL6086745.1 hypothetical protein [Klebsiella oxytoca]
MMQNGLFSNDDTPQGQTVGPVTCLGKTFANDHERRQYFLKLLAEKLKDPEFRKIEGFPIGNDDDILNLSDPPYYTACPNPWIAEFVMEWESQKIESEEEYHREPFAADISEGKNDPIYNAHSYHTKVPHKAIMRYILHYTNPGDIVFDGFCGTGMTGVAAQMCGDRNVILSLGYQVLPDGTILKEEVDEENHSIWQPFSRVGSRKAILNDLSPAASFISHNYNTPVDPIAFEKEATRILKAIESECGWMYETTHTDGRIGRINYTVWSDVFACPECTTDIVFWDEAVDQENGCVRDTFPCPNCGATLSKRLMKRAWVTNFDPIIGQPTTQARHAPVLINYSVDGLPGRFEKRPDQDDLELINKINSEPVLDWVPSNELPDGFNTEQPKKSHGFTSVHHFYTKRNLKVLAALRRLLKSSNMEKQLLCLVGDQLPRASKMHKIAISRLNTNLSKTAGVLAGTLYVPSNQIEYCLISMIGFRIADIISYQKKRDGYTRQIVSTASTHVMEIKDNSIDYMFFDPPFGSNINYSELNFLWEAWLKVFTNNGPEAIENKIQNKSINEYRILMTKCFRESYRILKEGRWLTVEFSNTKASVWNNIQSALTEAGFIVANVSALDKKQHTIKALTTPSAVKQDLVISAYKPNKNFEERFSSEAKTEEGVWDFVQTHLQYLPVTKLQGQSLLSIPERDPRILFDQLVAYYVRKGYQVPLDSREFQLGLSKRFSERDGMYFLHEQAAEYDKKKMTSKSFMQPSLFVKDEASAIDWLRQCLKDKPQAFSDINPQFMQQLSGWSKNEVVLDLRELLIQNFLCYDSQDDVPEQIHSYLSSNWKELRNLPKNDSSLIAKAKDRWYVPDPNKSGDLEKLRERSLLKEFEEYKAAKKKLKLFRIEAVRVGFKKLWEQQDFATLINVSDKLPSNVLEEDPILLMYYDQALTLSQTDTDDGW